MNANEMKNRVKEVLSGRLHEVPRDISVPKYYRWAGSEPIPQEGYEVEYHGDAARVLSGVGDLDQHLFPLRRRVRIEVDLNSHVAHVFLGPQNG
jgi:hypothetical protein